MINTVDGASSSRRIRRKIVVASLAVPAFYALLVCAHWIMEDYFRLANHDVYGVCQPIIFFMICGVLLASPIVAAIAVFKYQRLGHGSLTALCVVIALSPILFIYSRA